MFRKSISDERWHQAQAWELALWQSTQHKRGWKRLAWPFVRPLLAVFAKERVDLDDWNFWWARQFNNYDFLPRHVLNYIEVGCGPFTNTRLIFRGMTADHVVCSDPLAREYAKLRSTWLSRASRGGQILLDDHPLEECPFARDYFDVVVMINVLDHVRDADACLKIATGLVKPGGHIIIGQDLTDEQDLRQFPADDVGHPIRLAAADVEAHLRGFAPVINRTLTREEGRDPTTHCGDLVFAGKKVVGGATC